MNKDLKTKADKIIDEIVNNLDYYESQLNELRADYNLSDAEYDEFNNMYLHEIERITSELNAHQNFLNVYSKLSNVFKSNEQNKV